MWPVAPGSIVILWVHNPFVPYIRTHARGSKGRGASDPAMEDLQEGESSGGGPAVHRASRETHSKAEAREADGTSIKFVNTVHVIHSKRQYITLLRLNKA